jgi:nucleoside-diphosphate-sugar epimerase
VRIFVAGGTGVVGRRAIPGLVAKGHELTAVVRSLAKADLVSSLGAIPKEVSLFDVESLQKGVIGHDVVVNLATSIPPFSKASRSTAWRMNDRIRREGSKNLVDAALDAKVERYVQESVSFLYLSCGSDWIDETTEIAATSITASSVDAENQARRFTSAGGNGVILRFSSFYGPDSEHIAAMVRLARRGFGTTPGPREAYVSWVTTDDAAASVVAAVTEAPAGTYNVVDDDPVTRQEFDEILAAAVGRKTLRAMPGLLVRLMGDKLEHVVRSHRVSNRALRSATSWRRLHSVRDGIPAVLAQMAQRRPPTEVQPR